MKFFLNLLVCLTLIISCNEKPSLQYENGWHKAYVEIDNGNSEAAMAHTKDGLIDSICFSSDKCVGNFLGWTQFEHSQNVQGNADNENYTVYIIPDEWDQAKELFKKEEDNPDYR